MRPYIVVTDCPNESQKYSEAKNELKTMIDIKPNVSEDFAAIYEKFPCNYYSGRLLSGLVRKYHSLLFHFEEKQLFKFEIDQL